ncbi:transposase [Enterobacter mori]|uniref:transposase n=1 Tax=Enterobacter mori TaxID=539813 RepID=UPI002ACB10AC|nr:transposase [Enterobacter mori]
MRFPESFAYAQVLSVLYSLDTQVRFRILRNNVGKGGYEQIRSLSEKHGIELVKLHASINHVHLLVKVTPWVSIS